MPSHTTEVYQVEQTAIERVYVLRNNPNLFNIRMIQATTVALIDATKETRRRIKDNLPDDTLFYLVQYEDTQNQPQPPSQPPRGAVLIS